MSNYSATAFVKRKNYFEEQLRGYRLIEARSGFLGPADQARVTQLRSLLQNLEQEHRSYRKAT